MKRECGERERERGFGGGECESGNEWTVGEGKTG